MTLLSIATPRLHKTNFEWHSDLYIFDTQYRLFGYAIMHKNFDKAYPGSETAILIVHQREL